jgi:glucosamine--fructose-6-phosphate aminotransferase (isomerizing)
MCGIIAVLRKRSVREAPLPRSILERVDEALNRLRHSEVEGDAVNLGVVASLLESIDRDLKGTPGVACLLTGPGLAVADAIEARAEALKDVLTQMEARLDAGQLSVSSAELEEINATLVRLNDAAWALGRDRVRTARGIADLADTPSLTRSSLDAFWAIEVALSSLDRLEVRGRDSAGLHLLVRGHGLDLGAPDVRTLIGARTTDPLFGSFAVRTPAGHLSFVYKAAAEIGELGDNTRALRAAIRTDPLLHLAVGGDDATCTVLGHTRWASVGVISEANAHPLNSDELGRLDGPYLTAVLNGDVDNYLDLRAAEGLVLPPEMSSDAKVIPTLVSRQLAHGSTVEDGFRKTVARFDGSVAIGVSAADTPDHLYFALRGSGQSLNIGLAEDAFIVASEPYGLVEETTRYVRMDGEAVQRVAVGGSVQRVAGGEARHADGAPGQIVILDRVGAGTLAGVTRLTYEGNALPIKPTEVRTAEITTRDIDRSGFSHFLLKEISEAPASFRKTLRGKIVARDRSGRLAVRLGDETLPATLRTKLAAGGIARIFVIGQGTAAVAGQSVAAAIAACLASIPTTVTAVLATELSGFALVDDMSDTLVVAVSQSGTTTDTNRTVDLVRSRGAHVISIVNRRNSDLVDKSEGVLYTSDGRDVEMSVASTKAFYAQVAAGFLLALALADELGCGDRQRSHQLLAALRDLPTAMEQVLSQRDGIAEAASRLAPSRRSWAVVGNGPNRIAAAEIRIKLSELCYKSIACDGTEDKKHIDLSSEPLVLVCGAGLAGPTADDVAKEVAIYRAHKAAPVVIASAGEVDRFSAALHTIEVPAVDPVLAFVLSAMAGHLFGYEAALAIDAQARPLREARAAVEEAVSTLGRDVGDVGHVDDQLLHSLGPALRTLAERFFEGLREGAYNGHLEAGTAVRLASLFRYATGVLPVEGYELEYGKVGTPSAIVGDLVDALTAAIDELTRPVDAIKHQAKTVTVGISRSEDALIRVGLVREVLAAGSSQDCLSYRALRTLANLDPSVDEVLGFTRYRIEGDVLGVASIYVIDRGGVSRGITSRTDSNPTLRGTKHRAAEEREVTVAKGRSDGRMVILVPETKGSQVTGMTLLHVRFSETLPPATARQVLTGYRGRYAALADAVTETEATFDDSRLGDIPFVDLLTEPVYVLADRWRHR